MLALLATHVDSLLGDRCDAGLLPHLDKSLHGGDGAEHEHAPHDPYQGAVYPWLDEQPEADHDNPFRSFHQSALGVQPERLGLGSLVGDHDDTADTANGSTASRGSSVSAK